MVGILKLGLGLGLPQFTGRHIPEWLSGLNPEALGGIDFANNRSYGMEYDFARASVGYNLTAAGAFTSFAVDALRRTDRGALIEPARTNLQRGSLDPSVASGFYGRTNVTAAAPSGDQSEVRETVGAVLDHRIVSSAITVTASAISVNAVIKKVGRRYIYLRYQLDGANSRNIGFDLDTVSVTYAGTGMTGRISSLGPYFFLAASGVMSTTSLGWSIGTSTVAVASDVLPTHVGDVDQGFSWVYGQVEQASTETSRIDTAAVVATRSADDLDLKNFLGTKLRYTFDDSSTQDVTGISAPYQVPTNLNRAIIKNVISLP